MESAGVGARLASGAVTPLVTRLFVREGPGAGLTEPGKPVRISSSVAFRGERREAGATAGPAPLAALPGPTHPVAASAQTTGFVPLPSSVEVAVRPRRPRFSRQLPYAQTHFSPPL